MILKMEELGCKVPLVDRQRDLTITEKILNSTLQRNKTLYTGNTEFKTKVKTEEESFIKCSPCNNIQVIGQFLGDHLTICEDNLKGDGTSELHVQHSIMHELGKCICLSHF